VDLAKPVPVAWGCESRWGLPVRSFLVQRAISGAVDFSEYIRADGDESERRAVFRAVGEAVQALHSAGWIHGDLACRNLLVRPAGREVIFVDLARVKRTRPDRLGWRRRKELYRMVKSADKCGAAPAEVDAMMRAAAGDRAPAVIETTRQLRTIDGRTARKLRTFYWRLTGRRLPS
jgi:serine/threonine protein kinase